MGAKKIKVHIESKRIRYLKDIRNISINTLAKMLNDRLHPIQSNTKPTNASAISKFREYLRSEKMPPNCIDIIGEILNSDTDYITGDYNLRLEDVFKGFDIPDTAVADPEGIYIPSYIPKTIFENQNEGIIILKRFIHHLNGCFDPIDYDVSGYIEYKNVLTDKDVSFLYGLIKMEIESFAQFKSKTTYNDEDVYGLYLRSK